MNMPPAPDARSYTPTNISLVDAAAYVNRQNGFWARAEGDHVLWGLLPVQVANGDFIKTNLDAKDIDEMQSVIQDMDK